MQLMTAKSITLNKIKYKQNYITLATCESTIVIVLYIIILCLNF